MLLSNTAHRQEIQPSITPLLENTLLESYLKVLESILLLDKGASALNDFSYRNFLYDYNEYVRIYGPK